MTTDMTTNVNLVDKTIALFSEARASVADAIEALYLCWKQEAWSGRYDSWSEFCEDGLHISKSLGSQYVAVYGYYIEQSGLTVKQLRDVDMAKAYLALKLPGTAEKKLEMAQTLSRDELKLAVVEKDEIHQCQPITVCEVCHRRM